MTERLEEIEKLIDERDKYADVNGEKDYPNYDEQIFLLNDEGHIDYLVKRVKELEDENQRYKQALEEIVDSSTNEIAEFLARKALEESE